MHEMREKMHRSKRANLKNTFTYWNMLISIYTRILEVRQLEKSHL